MNERSDVEAALERVHVWAYPLLLAQRLRRNMTSMPPNERSAAAALGRMGHQRRLSDPGYRVGVAPNVDTLYSVAWVDLDRGPHRVDLPRVPERYYTLQVGFADSASVALGLRTHGEQLPPVVVRRSGTPPAALAGAVQLECPTRFAMFALRILVDGDQAEDLSEVWSLQDRVVLRCHTPSGWAPTQEDEAEGADRRCGPSAAGIARPVADAGAWLAEVQEVLQDIDRDQVPPTVLADLDVLARCWAGAPGAGTPASEWRNGALGRARRRVADAVSTTGNVMNGWAVNLRGCEFGEDWYLRAAVAHSQIYVNPAAEAVYPVAERDDQGRPLTGEHRYEMTFGLGERPPVRFFWSLTMYHAEGLLVENPARRYSVGDRTPGLQAAGDGPLIVRISSDESASRGAGGPGGVWLPAPRGPFRLMLRLYGPTREVLDGSWAPPPIRRV